MLHVKSYKKIDSCHKAKYYYVFYMKVTLLCLFVLERSLVGDHDHVIIASHKFYPRIRQLDRIRQDKKISLRK